MTDLRYARMRRLSLLAVLLTTLAGVAACGDGEADAAATEEHTEGEEHAAGAPDVVLLDSAAVAVARITTTPVATVRTTGLPVTGTITYDANRVSHIGPRTSGRIMRLMADIGERVRGGQALAILESPDVGQVRAEEHRAEALVKIARENYNRERRLEEQGISSRKELLDAEADLRRAEADLLSARERLQALGAGQGQGGQFAITAPFPGVIVDRDASLGEMATPADPLFTVANLERLWIELDVFERDLARISPGQPVDVTTTAYPNRAFPGKVAYVGDILDPEKRTVRARVEVTNEDRALRPGMFASARIRVGESGPPVIAIPEDAVQELEGRKVVFVPGARPGEFRAVPIETGELADEGRITVLSGLKAGDRVVTSGAFTLRSDLAKGEIGEHGH